MLSPDFTDTVDDNGCSEDSIADLLVLIRAEYDEMPGLHLTPPQVCRLFGIDPHTGETVMRMLVDEGIVTRTATGAFIRRRRLH